MGDKHVVQHDYKPNLDGTGFRYSNVVDDVEVDHTTGPEIDFDADDSGPGSFCDSWPVK
jgi:hypothetical protein